jgi:urease accessory protein
LVIICTAFVFAVLPTLAFAHPGHGGGELTWDFSGGFAHPFSGWDHLLAMLAVGLWAAQLGGRARWLVPAAFISVMALGALLGHDGLTMPGIEQGIATTVFVLGLLIAASVRLPVGVGMALAGLFALFHGLAHGAEMPATAGGLAYGSGFVAATALLHLAGLGLGIVVMRRSVRSARYIGWAIATAGFVLAVA